MLRNLAHRISQQKPYMLGEWNGILRVLKEKLPANNINLAIFFFSRYKGKIRIFLDQKKRKTEGVHSPRSALQELLKGVLQPEMKRF